MVNTSNENKLGWIGSASSLVALTSAVSILISMLYEIGYYQFGIGIPIQAIPTSMSDHIKACFMWLPLAIFVIAVAIAMILILMVKDHRDKIDLASDSKEINTPNKYVKFKYFNVTMMIVYAIFALYCYYSNEPSYKIIYNAIFVLYFALILILDAFAEKFIAMKKFSLVTFGLILGFIFIVTIMVSNGYRQGKLDINPKQYKDEITLRDASSTKLKANVLRVYDKATFFIYSSQKLVFMPNDQIKMITMK